jgi:single-stranded DNA-binding protein
MNKFTAVGRLPRAAILNGGEKKVLRFTLATVYGFSRKTNKNLVAYVPCVLFQPPEELKQVLMENWKDTTIEVEGHVATSKFETKDHETKYSTEVVVDSGGVRPIVVPEPLPFD